MAGVAVRLPLLGQRVWATRLQGRSFPRAFTGRRTYSEIVGSQLIPVVNRLQEVFALTQTSLQLPQIVVVGSQSSGKSSVLENLVGRDFLPRGSGIVTRRPLILQLTRVATNEEWGEFSHIPQKKWFDFAEIRQEIERDTNRIAGHGKGISPYPIILKIHSPNVLPLTLVDTPGIARLPVGDQPGNIEELIKEMVTDFIKPDTALILAVQPANQDIATSDALNLARRVDVNGRRTIGVLTKLDVMDRGTDASGLLLGQTHPLALGYVGVVNRSQADIAAALPISLALEREAAFFAQHPVYKQPIFRHRLGCAVLSKKCNQQLTHHIKEYLPTLKQSIKHEASAAKQELTALGEPPGDSKEDMGWMMLDIVNKFCQEYVQVLEGTRGAISTESLNPGARIRYVINESFAKKLSMIDPTAGLTMDAYRNAIRNASGPRASVFVPEAAFELLAQRQIEQLREPCLRCCDLVYRELTRIVEGLHKKELDRFPILHERVNALCRQMLMDLMKPTKEMINRLVDMQLVYINASHPDFLARAQSVVSSASPVHAPKPSSPMAFFSRMFSGMGKSSSPSAAAAEDVDDEPPEHITETLSSREEDQIRAVQHLLVAYFSVTTKIVQDCVVKCIWMGLVDASKRHMQDSLTSSLYKDELFSELLRESAETAALRESLRQRIAALEKAKKILKDAETGDFSARNMML